MPISPQGWECSRLVKVPTCLQHPQHLLANLQALHANADALLGCSAMVSVVVQHGIASTYHHSTRLSSYCKHHVLKPPLVALRQGNYQNGGAYGFILFITFWILYSYLVPISLFVTLEIVKFWQVRQPFSSSQSVSFSFSVSLVSQLSSSLYKGAVQKPYDLRPPPFMLCDCKVHAF